MRSRQGFASALAKEDNRSATNFPVIVRITVGPLATKFQIIEFIL
jgi:hypothetical protein